MCRSILSLSKITHQMWHDYLFIQRKWSTERILGMGLEVTGEWGEGLGWKKTETEGVGNIEWVFIK